MSYDYEDLSGGGNYHSWDSPGDTVEGIIRMFTIDGGSDYNGNPCPELVIATNDGNGPDVTVTAGQASLKRKCERNANRLQPGHAVKITYTEDMDTGKGNPAKLFDVASTPVPVKVDLPAAAPESVADAGEPF